MTKISSTEQIGSVLILGAGIAGIQASLDLAESGFKVYIVERKGSIGGNMSKLDKTFPTNDCSMCMLSPKLIACESHPDIDIITMAELIDLDGSVGNFTARIKRHPRFVDDEKCNGCGLCAQKCPVTVKDNYNEGLMNRKAIYIDYPQASPLVYAIDPEYCIFFKNGKCRACERFCKSNAINFYQQEENISIKVGTVILAPGFELFNPENVPEYGYGRYQNVITNMEFERILSATGPYNGMVVRPSDNEVPEKVAWIQCVGSRESIRNGREFCSSICCMSATKEALIASEHHSDLSSTIFYLDLRAQGKGFDAYCQRAEQQGNVRYIRSMISRVAENPATKEPVLTYVDPDTNEMNEEAFGMVVLSVGISPSVDSSIMAERLHIDLNRFGFAKTQSDSILCTSREGIYVCGMFEGPKDIPETVAQASGAAALASLPIKNDRGKTVTEPSYPAERYDIYCEPRIGVFICCCGTNISGVVDVEETADYIKGLPGVVVSHVFLFACSTDSKEKIKELILKKDLNRIVIASCSPRTHELLFRNTLKEAGINPYLLEMANIRNQCSWVHADQPLTATRKAKDLIRMSVGRVALQQPILSKEIKVERKCLIVGGGIAGLTASFVLAENDIETHLVEQSETLGGRHASLLYNPEGNPPNINVEELIKKVKKHPNITLHTRSTVKEFTGRSGDFCSEIGHEKGMLETVRHGTVIIATGAEEYHPTEYLYGINPNVITQSELMREFHENLNTMKSIRSVAMIQCVGSRTEKNPYCSRICCKQAVTNSLKLKKINPDAEVFVLYRDIRTFGFNELIYRDARKHGVIFIRYSPETPPEVFEENGVLHMSFTDPSIGRRVTLLPERIVLSTGLRPHKMSPQVADIFKLPRDNQGFFLEAHIKLRPLDFAADGLFLCGDAHSPKLMEETVAQAAGAAGRAMSILCRDTITCSGPYSQVDPELCSACMTCVLICPYHVPFINTDGISEIDPAQCKGCGICAAECPAQAITLHHYTNNQVFGMIEALFNPKPSAPTC